MTPYEKAKAWLRTVIDDTGMALSDRNRASDVLEHLESYESFYRNQMTSIQDLQQENESLRRALAVFEQAVPQAGAQNSNEHIDFSKANPTTQAACRFLIDVAKVLLEKERGYGDAREAVQVFAPHIPVAVMYRTRIDNKLTRIRSLGTATTDEDTLKDLVGYLALLRAIESVHVPGGHGFKKGQIVEVTEEVIELSKKTAENINSIGSMIKETADMLEKDSADFNKRQPTWRKL